jgi:hypothetical protein
MVTTEVAEGCMEGCKDGVARICSRVTVNTMVDAEVVSVEELSMTVKEGLSSSSCMLSSGVVGSAPGVVALSVDVSNDVAVLSGMTELGVGKMDCDDIGRASLLCCGVHTTHCTVDAKSATLSFLAAAVVGIGEVVLRDCGEVVLKMVRSGLALVDDVGLGGIVDVVDVDLCFMRNAAPVMKLILINDYLLIFDLL